MRTFWGAINYKIGNMHTDVAYCCIIVTTTKWGHVSLFLESKKKFMILLHSSSDSSALAFDSSVFLETTFKQNVPVVSGSNWSNLRAKRVIYQTERILCTKRISMSTDFKVLSLACKCVFYRSEHAKGGEHNGIKF